MSHGPAGPPPRLGPKAIAGLLRDRLSESPADRAYAVIDASRALDLALLARTTYNMEIHSLFRGPRAGVMDGVAPYLVPIDVFAGYLERWAEEWGNAPGILLSAPVETFALAEHLGRVFRVFSAGRPCFLRFYDPRVIQRVLPEYGRAELAAFFGPVRRFLMEGEDGGAELVGASLSATGTLRWSNRSLDA